MPVVYFLCLRLYYFIINIFATMKNTTFGRILGAALIVIIVGSTIVNHYVRDHDLSWVFLANEGLLLGVWIGVAGYDWVRRRG